MFHHSPEIIEGYCFWTLSGDGSFIVEGNPVCIYVVLDCVRGRETYASGLEGHKGGVAVEGELLGVFVEFIDVMLGLGHEGE